MGAGGTPTTHVIVRGIVQGVGFRYWTQREAVGLGLRGWVRNLFDGRVEIVLQGEKSAVDTMVARCKGGPSSADVQEHSKNELTAQKLDGFEIRPSSDKELGKTSSTGL